MKNMRLGTRLVLAVTILAGLLLVAGAVGLSGIVRQERTLAATANQPVRAMRALQEMTAAYGVQLVQACDDASANAVDWAEARKHFDAALRHGEAGWQLLQAALAGEPATIAALATTLEPLTRTAERVRTAVQREDRDALRAVAPELRHGVVAFAARATEISESQSARVASRVSENESDEGSLKSELVVFTGVALILAVILGFMLRRLVRDLAALVAQVQSAGVQVSTSVMEIAATAKQQQATANEIAASTSEIGATSKEISATSNELAKAMTEVADGAEETATLAGQGQSGLSRMEETMRHVMEAAAAINAKLGVLNEKAGNINQVVTTITKVADQTNLLSLNASIEAEKAGEYGRGFAVVATEIRRLADQTAVATFDIEQIVKEMLSAVSASVMGMDKFSEEVRRGVDEVRTASSQLTQIIDRVQGLTPRFETVNGGMRAQATGAQQISEALSQLSEAAQQTVESLRQSNAAIDQLNETARGMRESVERIKT